MLLIKKQRVRILRIRKFYYFKRCGHNDQGQGVESEIIGLVEIHPGATMFISILLH